MLGPHPRPLNRDHTCHFTGRNDNQLLALASKWVDAEGLPLLARWIDALR